LVVENEFVGDGMIDPSVFGGPECSGAGLGGGSAATTGRHRTRARLATGYADHQGTATVWNSPLAAMCASALIQ
jgi:hypothetical protein